MTLLLTAASTYDPELQWTTLVTPGFRVHFHEGERDLAARVAELAERIAPELEAELGFRPEGPVHVVLTDSSDAANGSAEVLPNNVIRLYMTAPTESTGLEFYDDWLETLVTHELMHIVHIDMTAGYSAALRLLLGKYIANHRYDPQWITEGYATYAETVLTRAGRGRATYVDMVVRVAALEDDFVGIDQANLSYDDWPSRSVAYFFGVKFQLYLRERFGAEAVAGFHRHYAGLLVPYLFELSSEEAFGAGLSGLWDEWRHELRKVAERQGAAVRARGETRARRLTHGGRNTTGPRYSPDGSYIVYSRTSPYDGATVRRLARDGAKDELLVLETFSRRVAFEPGGRAFWYAQASTTSRFDNHNDLYRYQLSDGDSTILRGSFAPRDDCPTCAITEARPAAGERDAELYDALRARDPHVSADGRRIVFVQTRLGKNSIVVGELGARPRAGADEEPVPLRTLVAPQNEVQHSAPRFAPDGATLAVSSWAGGMRDLYLLDATTGAIRTRFTNDRALDADPTFSPDGRWLLFSSDRTGIYNLFAIELASGRAFQVTNVIGGAFQPEVSPDGRSLLFLQYGAGGFDIYEMAFDPAAFIPTELTPRDPAAVLELLAGRFAEVTSPVSDSAFVPAPAADAPALLAPEWELRPYSPWESVLPFHDNWNLLPFVAFNELELRLGATTLGSDVLGEHRWNLTGVYSTLSEFTSAYAAYANDSWFPTLVLSGAVTAESFPGRLLVPRPEAHEPSACDEAAGDAFACVGDGVYNERREAVGFGADWPLAARGHRFSLAYVYEHRGPLYALPASVEDDPLPVSGSYARLAFGYRYSFLRDFPYSISRERGRTIAAALTWYAPPLGSGVNEVLLTFDYREYLEVPGLLNHVLALRATGGLTPGPEFVEVLRLGGTGGSSALSAQTVNSYPLRGFPLAYFQGHVLWALYAEYRWPLWYPQRGVDTLPVFFDAVHLGLFADLGDAYPVPAAGGDATERAGERLALAAEMLGTSLRHPNLGAGVELRADVTFGWLFPLTVRLGLARAVLVSDRVQPPLDRWQLVFDLGASY